MGKKNWLFFGAEEAGVRNAVVFTLIGNSRMHGVERYEYLKDVLERLPRTTNRQVEQFDAAQLEESPGEIPPPGRLNLLRPRPNPPS